MTQEVAYFLTALGLILMLMSASTVCWLGVYTLLYPIKKEEG